MRIKEEILKEGELSHGLKWIRFGKDPDTGKDLYTYVKENGRRVTDQVFTMASTFHIRQGQLLAYVRKFVTQRGREVTFTINDRGECREPWVTA